MQDYYVVRTLGCKANLYDSEQIEAELRSRGWLPVPEGGGLPRLCIVNSCTVTDEADRQSRRLASRLARENPAARVVVTGCGAEVDPERLARSAGIHYVVGNQDKPRMVDLVLSKLETPGPATDPGLVLGHVLSYGELVSRHPMDREWPLPARSFGTPATLLDGNAGKTRAFLKIQEGCNSFCTYCIIPYGRGPSRSLEPAAILAQVRTLVERGIREIVITGTNIGDYGIDWGMDPATALASLFGRLLDETGLERLRVGSLDPTEITEPLFALMERDPRFCPHFHVSLQAAHDRILRLMKRKYGVAQARETLARIAALPAPIGGAFVGMDVITGFPGETESEFEAGFEELSRLPWSRLHVFPYSEREGTPATRLPGAVKPEVRAARARRLGELSLARVREKAERALRESREAGQRIEGILLEKPSAKPPVGAESMILPASAAATGEKILWAQGYTANYLRVYLPLPESRAHALRNQLVAVEVEQVIVDRAQGDAALLGTEPS